MLFTISVIQIAKRSQNQHYEQTQCNCLFDNTVGLLHDDAVGNDGHNIPVIAVIQGYITKYIFLPLIAELSRPRF